MAGQFPPEQPATMRMFDDGSDGDDGEECATGTPISGMSLHSEYWTAPPTIAVHGSRTKLISRNGILISMEGLFVFVT